MSKGEYKLIKANSGSNFDEKTIQSIADNALGFDSDLNPKMIDIINPAIETITRPQRSDINFVFEGNSRTSLDRYGSIVGYENQFPSYPSQLMELSNFVNRGDYYNVATWGQSNDVIFGRYTTNVKPYRPYANGGAAGISESYLFIMSGILDVLVNPSTVDYQIAAYKSYCDAAKADGFKVIVLGEFYGVFSSYNNTAELARLKYNNAMANYAKDGNIYMYIDVDHLIGTDMTDVYHADTSFHLTTEGKKLIADYVNSRFNPGAYVATDSNIPYVTMPQLYRKQNTLISGTTIKTINNTTLLGSGNVVVMPIEYEVGDIINDRTVLFKGYYEDTGMNEVDEQVIVASYNSTVGMIPEGDYNDALAEAASTGDYFPTMGFMMLLDRAGYFNSVKNTTIKFWGADQNGTSVNYFYFDQNNNLELSEGITTVFDTCYSLTIRLYSGIRYNYSAKVSDIGVGAGMTIDDSTPQFPNIGLNLVTAWSETLSDDNIPSEKLVKDSISELVFELPIVTTWSNPTLNTNIPSEKLVKDTIDAIDIELPIVTTWSATTLDSNIPSEKLVKDTIDGLNPPTLVTISVPGNSNTYSIGNYSEVEITGGSLTASVTSTFTMPTYVSGKVNSGLIHFYTGATLPTSISFGSNAKWKDSFPIGLIANRKYTVYWEKRANNTSNTYLSWGVWE